MKRVSPLSLVILLSLIAAIILQTSSAQSEPAESDAVLRHVVLLKFKEDTSDEKIKEVVDAFANLPQEIDVIRDFEWGHETTAAPFAKGFTHCFLVTFNSEEDRAAYLPHQGHRNLVTLITPVAADVLVVDYWTGK